MEYYFDPEADDFGASVPEDFLGEKIGYINGIRVTENIVDPDENAEFVEYNRITDEEWDAIVREAAMGERTAQPMKDIYAFGFKGEKLILPSGEAEAAMLASVEDDVAFMSLNVAPSSDGSVYDVGADSELKQVENVYDVEADTELKQVETAEPLTLLPISDVLYDPNPVSTFFGRRAARAGSEWAIENYVLWDGTVVKGGSVVKPDYEDGYYVIVMQPCMPEAAVYNSFLGFASTTEERPAFTMDGYCEPSNAFFEDWFRSVYKELHADRETGC